jgi:hypothetical protein
MINIQDQKPEINQPIETELENILTEEVKA